MVGQTISHYTILEKLGEGGMGVVYKAQDTRLDRLVALKFLPHHLTANDAEKARFLHEAKAAAALNHPNVCSVIDIQEDSGQQFIVMEFVEGVTLREKISSGRVVSTQDAIVYAIQIGEALQAAHAKGIVHRDVKSENIMLSSDGRIKVMDFGLAKLKGSLKLTKTSSTVGTLAYMAPEQLQGGEADTRSDIFSFGVVCFEILTGHIPFRGEHEAALMYSIVNEEPESITQYRQDLSPELDRIIHRALEKDPDDRYQHVDDMVSELRRLQKTSTRVVRPAQLESSRTTQTMSVPVVSKKLKMRIWIAVASTVLLAGAAWLLFLHKPGEQITSIAVLPFQNKSSDADTDYLSDGLAESLIYRLSQLPNLKVSPTSSVFRYKGKEMEPTKIGSELGVSAVMSGRIVQRGDKLTISIELVDVRNDKLLWGEQYDRKMSDLLLTQREIAAAVAQKLQLKLGGSDTNGLTKHYTENNEAYQLYLKGRFHFARRTKDDIQRSIEAYQEAIRLDPNFALAYVGVAESYVVMPSYPYMSPEEATPQAKTAIAKALALDPELPEAYTVSGIIASVYDWNWQEAERQFKRALELDPNLALTHYRYAWVYLSPMGRHEEAIAEMKRAMELEPLSLVQGANFAAVYMYARRFDEAAAQAKMTYDLDPGFVTGQSWVCNTYNAKGMYAQSLVISEQTLQSSFPFFGQLGYAYAKSGRRQDAEALISKWKEIEKTKYVMNYWIAVTYAALGDKNAAFAELEKSYQHHDWFLPRLKTDPFMDPLRDDPRFAALVKKVGLEK
jgi:serine/threonine-protein kinase